MFRIYDTTFLKGHAVRTFFLMIFLALAASPLYSQSFDHEKHPQLDFDFQKLSLELGIQPQNMKLEGAAEYDIRANIAGADTLTLYASHLDISAVQVNGKDAEFSLHNDSLLITVDDSSEAGEKYKVYVRYSGQPNFGLLKNSNGTLWTSQLPRAERHWVPVVDNPHVSFKTQFSISVPSGNQVWATGRMTGEEVVSVDIMKFNFASAKEIPASSLSFAIGKFNNKSDKKSAPRITVSVEPSLTDTIDAGKIAELARSYTSEVSSRLSKKYPFETLNVVAVNDHHWETKSWGANMVFIYQNRGSIEAQLLRGIAAQWFGIIHREEQWNQAGALALYQTLLADILPAEKRNLTRKDQPKHSFSTIYDNYGPANWNSWQDGISRWVTPTFRKFISDSASAVLNQPPKVISWDDYADYWYRHTGQPLYEIPSFTISEKQKVKKEPSDSVVYDVFYTLNEADGQLKLRFSARKGMISELTTLNVVEVYSGKTEKSEVTFTGREDSVMLQVEPTISNLNIDDSKYQHLVLNEFKPASFLIYQMKNAETVQERAEAAGRLGYHSENPDLQLAIKDFMSRELEPEVRAALLKSLADITKGAAGTQQTFLDALDSKNKKIRNAGLMALQNYEGNSAVMSRVKSEARNAETMEFFRKSTRVLMSISSDEEFNSFVEGVVSRDTVGRRSIFAIQELANMGNTEEAIKRANLFTASDYRYDIRSQALKILIQHDHAPANWIARAKDLMSDPDPRIRFLLVEGMEKNANKEITTFLKEHIQDEYDARVHRKIEQILR